MKFFIAALFIGADATRIKQTDSVTPLDTAVPEVDALDLDADGNGPVDDVDQQIYEEENYDALMAGEDYDDPMEDFDYEDEEVVDDLEDFDLDDDFGQEEEEDLEDFDLDEDVVDAVVVDDADIVDEVI